MVDLMMGMMSFNNCKCNFKKKWLTNLMLNYPTNWCELVTYYVTRIDPLKK